MNMKRIFLLCGIVLIGVGVIWAWTAQRNTAPSSDKISVVASFYPLAEFARQVGGDKVDVQTLLHPGVEPHDYEPTPKDITALHEAEVFVYNGAGLEPWADRLSKELDGKGMVQVEAAKGLAVRRESQDAPDPHVWLDPVLAQQQVRKIADALSNVDAANRDFYQAQAAAYVAQLAELDQNFQQGMAQCTGRQIVASHEAFGYLADRYKLQLLAIAGLSPEEEPSPQKLADVAEFVKANQVRYIFFETLVSPKLAETIATETGAKTTVLNPLEGVTEQEIAKGVTYISLQKENLQNLRLALNCT